MPFLRLPGSISLHYTILPALEDAAAEERLGSKPWLVVLSPVVADECSRIPQVQDPRLRAAFNLLCIDLRSQGRSRGVVKASYDCSVAAADVAFVMEALQIPPAYIFAPGFIAFHVGVKLALLFPSQVRALAFAGTPHMYGQPAGIESFREIDRYWMQPQDSEDFEEALTGLHHSFTGGHGHGPSNDPVHTNIIDEAMGVMIRRYNPREALAAHEFTHPIHQDTRLTPEIVASITVPVLLMQDDFTDTFTELENDECRDAFTGSTDFEHHIIEGGSPIAWWTHAEQVSTLLVNFLLRQAASTSFVQDEIMKPLDLGYALSMVAKLADNGRVLTRNPRDTESYSVLSPEAKASRIAHIEVLRKASSECRLRIPGSKDLETWELVAQPTTARPRRRWRFSRRHDERPQRGNSLRTSVVEGVSVAIQKSQQEEYELESESGESTCSSSSHPTTPTSSSSPPVSWVHTSKPLPAAPHESFASTKI